MEWWLNSDTPTTDDVRLDDAGADAIVLFILHSDGHSVLRPPADELLVGIRFHSTFSYCYFSPC